MNADRLREAAQVLRERAEGATPGPWEVGDRWHIQGASHCQCLERHGPLIHAGRMNINGQMMQAHVHEADTPWHAHTINARPSKRSAWHVANVVNDTDEYGYVTDPDAAYIAMMSPPVALALADWLDDLADHDPSPLMPTEAGAFKVADAVLGGGQR